MIFLNIFGCSNVLGTATDIKTVVGGKQLHVPFTMLISTYHFFVSVKFHGDHKTVKKLK